MCPELSKNIISVNYPRMYGTRENTRALCTRVFARTVFVCVRGCWTTIQLEPKFATVARKACVRTHRGRAWFKLNGNQQPARKACTRVYIVYAQRTQRTTQRAANAGTVRPTLRWTTELN